ncbi:MAG: hypothetical protein P8L85_21580 [Rubripirellula sp.]|nr:hypothetical protein [Rubripirellula sp.]
MIHSTLEQRLVDVAGTWKWQRVIKVTVFAIAVVLVAALAIGVLIHLGWIDSFSVGVTSLISAVLLSVFGWLIGVTLSLDRRLGRRWLAASVEQGEPLLMDRLNAVVELEHRSADTSAKMYRTSIEQQATEVLREHRQRNPFPWFTSVAQITAMLMLLLGTVLFYQRYQPFRSLASKQAAKQPVTSQPKNRFAIPQQSNEVPSDPALPDESTEPWGQIRISEPGRNLRLTKYEEIPLMIEAASDRPLSEVYWETSVNQETWGTANNQNSESKHDLPLSEDPRYGVFQPTLSPSELGMSTWDLAIYRAVAQTEDESKYESMTYFVEIIPSRDQLDELPGSAIERLEQVSDLILQQQQVIHKTERLQNSADGTELTRMDALAQQERRLAMATETARNIMQQRLPFDATKSFDSAMQSARRRLQEAETVLDTHDASNALEIERLALMNLVAARRELSYLVEKYPEAFDRSTTEAIEQERLQGATPTDPKLSALMDRLDRETQRTAAVAEQMESLATQQQQIVDQLPVSEADQYPWLAAKQQTVEETFESLQQLFAIQFRDLTFLSEQAKTSLSKSSESLQQQTDAAETAAQQAADKLNQLAEILSERAMANELLQGDTLQERLQANRNEYQTLQDSPDQFSPESLTQTTTETQNLIQQLQQLADRQSNNIPDEESADRSALSKQLTPKLTNELTAQCDAIEQTADDKERAVIAKSIGESLDKIADSLNEEMLKQGSKLEQQQVSANLRRMLEQTESMQAARETVQKALIEQQDIERTAFTYQSRRQQYPQIAQRQLDLQQQMQQAIEEYPAPFQQTQPQTQAALSAMQQTSRSLDAKQPDAADMAEQAAKRLRDLDKALEKRQQQQGVSEKQRIGDMLERLQKRLGEMAKSPQQVTEQEKQMTAAQSQEVGAKAVEMTGPDPSGPDPGGTNPSGTDPGGTDPGGTDPSGTDPSGTDPSGTDPSGTDPGGTNPGGTDPSGTDPSGTNPSGTNPGGTNPGGTDPSGTNPSGTDPSGTDPSGTNPSGTNPSGTNPSGTNPSGTNPGGTDPSGTDPSGGQSPPNDEKSLANDGPSGSTPNSNPQNEPEAAPDNREQQLNTASDRLAESKGESQTASAASNLQQQLQSLAEALSPNQSGGQQSPGQGRSRSGQQGRPGSQPESQSNGRYELRPDGKQAIQRGLAQLESAARQASQGKLTRDAKQTLQRGGVADLLAGIQAQYGSNENTRSVAMRLNEQLQDPTSPVDLQTLQQLREQIQTLQQGLTVRTESQQPAEPTRRVNPNRFPPAYRESIQKYFETLSEQQ